MSALTTDAAAGALVQAASDPMWALDAELRLTAFNEAFAELVRAAWGAEPALGLAVDALPERVAGRHRAAYQRALKGERFRFDWSVDPIDAIWSVELAPIVEEGRTRGVTAIARDVSERKRLHQELLAAQASAERANQAQSEFLAMVSHELRTPLNAIVGLTRVAAEGPVDGQQSLLARVEQNASHLLHLVTDLLDFSRIDGGLLELRPVPASFRRMVEQEVEAVRPAVERRGLELNVQLDASLPRQVMVDRERVRQIIENLLTNAVRYTHHGRISIEATWIEPKDGETMIQLTVRDTGIGIAKAEQKLIFTRFYRSTRSASGRAEGTGLGLAITKAVVDRMGGQI